MTSEDSWNWTECGQYLRSGDGVDLINIKYHQLLVNWSIIQEQLIFVTALNIYSLNVRKYYSRKLYLFYPFPAKSCQFQDGKELDLQIYCYGY